MYKHPGKEGWHSDRIRGHAHGKFEIQKPRGHSAHGMPRERPRYATGRKWCPRAHGPTVLLSSRGIPWHTVAYRGRLPRDPWHTVGICTPWHTVGIFTPWHTVGACHGTRGRLPRDPCAHVPHIFIYNNCIHIHNIIIAELTNRENRVHPILQLHPSSIHKMIPPILWTPSILLELPPHYGIEMLPIFWTCKIFYNLKRLLLVQEKYKWSIVRLEV